MFNQMLKKVPLAGKVARLLAPPTKKQHRQFLLAALPKHAIGAEIGVHLGDFSEQLLRVTEATELHLIDPWAYEESREYRDAWYGGKVKGGQAEMDERHARVCARFAAEMQSGRVKVHRGYSAQVLESLPDEYFDWVYIDGNHLHEFVKKDLELAFAKTKRGGCISGDDYTTEGWWQGGVKTAVDEFCRTMPVQPSLLPNQQFLLRK
jgi:hypothetical protein